MAAGTALGKFNVTSNLKSLEREAVESFRALEKAEKGFEPGLRFGQAMIDLRNSEGMKHGEWMDTLKRLGITYRKADYWMGMVMWQNGERPTSPRKPSIKKKARFDWDEATDWLDQLKSKVNIIRKHAPGAADRFANQLIQFAAELRSDKGKRGRK